MTATPVRPFQPEVGRGLRHGLAVRVRQLRAALGVTQARMSARLGRANNNAVSRIEREANVAIPLDLLEGLVGLAEEAGYSAQWLLTGNGSMKNAPEKGPRP